MIALWHDQTWSELPLSQSTLEVACTRMKASRLLENSRSRVSSEASSRRRLIPADIFTYYIHALAFMRPCLHFAKTGHSIRAVQVGKPKGTWMS